MRILVAEDDVRLAELLEESLVEAGWQVVVVHDGRAAYEQLIGATDYDVALLDWMLPGEDGVSVVRRLRSIGLRTPVLLLTARGELRDRVGGLDAGADDYLPKPFNLEELLARLRALYRRRNRAAETPVTIGDLVIDPVARRVNRNGHEIVLSAREFDILHLLASRAGQVVTRLDILDEVWDESESDIRSNVIDVHLAAIRTKIDKPFDTATIKTVRGVGYRLDLPASR